MSGKRLSASSRRELIIKSALALFAQKGPEAASTRDITKAAGVSATMLYKHFPSKQSLYLTLADYVCQKAHVIGEQIHREEINVENFFRNFYFFMYVNRFGSSKSDQEIQNLAKLILHGFIHDDVFGAQIFQHNIAPWIERQRGESLLNKENLLYAEDTSFGNRLWMAQLLSFAMLSVSLAKNNPPIAFAEDEHCLFNQTVVFALRGLAVKDEAIKHYYKPQRFWSYVKDKIH